MFSSFSKFFGTCSVLALLSACGAGGDAHDHAAMEQGAAQNAPRVELHGQRVAPVGDTGSSAAVADPAAADSATLLSVRMRGGAALMANLTTPTDMPTEAERYREELARLAFEQSFSIELNRRQEEAPELAKQAEAAVRAGVRVVAACWGLSGMVAEECNKANGGF